MPHTLVGAGCVYVSVSAVAQPTGASSAVRDAVIRSYAPAEPSSSRRAPSKLVMQSCSPD